MTMKLFTGGKFPGGKSSSGDIPPPPPTVFELNSRNSIAGLGTNGLTVSNYTASSTYYADHPAGAFDADSPYRRSVWLSDTGNVTDQWLAVDLGNNASITGFATVNAYSLGVNGIRKFKNIIFQTSDDGITYNNVQSFVGTLGAQVETFTLDSPVTSRYIRLFIIDNHGGDYIIIDELDVFQE